MSFDFENKQYIGCIPVEAHPSHPSDQSPCAIWDCPTCDKPMWVSENKVKFHDATPNSEIHCLKCLAIAAIKEGYEPELQDITEVK